MGLLRTIRDYENSKDILHDRVNELGEFITKSPGCKTPNEILAYYGRLQMAIKWLDDSWGELVDFLDESMGVVR